MPQPKSEDIELKPCPFCGSDNLDYDSDGGFISCKNCLAYGPDCTTEMPLFDSNVDEDEARAAAKKLCNKRASSTESPNESKPSKPQ